MAKQTDPPDHEERQGVTNFSPTRFRVWEKHPTSTMVGNTIFSVCNASPLHAARSCMTAMRRLELTGLKGY